MNKNKNVRRTYNKSAIVFGLVIIVALIAGGVIYLTSHNHSKPVTASAYTKGEQATGSASSSSAPSTTSSNQKSSSANNTSQVPGDQKGTGGQQTTTLLSPSGDFVSNHHPNLSGSPAPSLESSVCTTTPGAKCTISFTKDGVTKSLPSETTDRGGSVYWNWDVAKLGLTTGSWKIQATATLDNQTKTSADALNLEVAQ